MKFIWRVGLSILIAVPWILLISCSGWEFRGGSLARSVRLGDTELNTNRTRAVLDEVLTTVRRPLLVRFNWYVDGVSPVHYGYGGDSAMTIFSQYGFVMTTTNEWDLLWTMVPQWENMASPGNKHYKPRPWQIHNHCLALKDNQGMAGTKDSQWKHIRHMQQRYGLEEFNFMPETFVLPDDSELVKDQLQKSPQPWVLKPVIGKQAIGVSIVTNKKQLPNYRKPEMARKRFVLQKYITNPLLLHGRKFHMRLYLVLTSLSPLRVLRHNEGLVLFATHNYSRDASTYGDMKIHLTNSAVADRSNAQHTINGWLLSKLWDHLDSQLGAGKVSTIKQSIDDAFVKLALSAQLEAGGYEQRRSGSCFDLFGVDVLIDERYQIHVMEVNVGPEVVSPNPDTHKANDCAHKAVLNDLVPLVAMSATPEHIKQSFREKLAQFMTIHKLSLCPPNVFVLETAECLSSLDIGDLWRLHREMEMLGNFRHLYPAAGTSTRYTQFFHAGLDGRNYWALKWVSTHDTD